MKRERLMQMMDLVLSCEKWGFSHRVALDIDNTGYHRISVHPYVGDGSTCTIYEAKDFWGGTHHRDGYVIDPNFEKAEEHIRRLIAEIGVGDDDEDA